MSRILPPNERGPTSPVAYRPSPTKLGIHPPIHLRSTPSKLTSHLAGQPSPLLPFSSSLLALSVEPSSPPSSSQPRRRRAARSPRHRRAARCPWRLPTTKTKSPTSPTGKTPPSAGPCACGFLVFGRVPVCTLCLSIWPAVCAPVLNC